MLGEPMFVSTADLEAFGGLKRAAAQARFLNKLGIRHVRRQDGSIASRQAELDAYTLSNIAMGSRATQTLEPRLLLA
jgi:hypothetical protein